MPLWSKHHDMSLPIPPQKYERTAVHPAWPVSSSSNEVAAEREIAAQLNHATRTVHNADQAFQVYQRGRFLKAADRSGEVYETAQTKLGPPRDLMVPLKSAYGSDAMKGVRDGVKAFTDTLPGLLKALDTVSKLHPFIALAVGAFKVAIELDTKRREDDKKITVLFVEMKEMMAVLLELGSIKDQLGPDHTTIEVRLRPLVCQTAEDVKTCANACDTYSKKKLIVKVIKGAIWDSTLQGFIELFARRRKDISFHISVHVGLAMDDAKRRLEGIDEKMNLVIGFFRTLVTPEQQELGAVIARKGGPRAVMRNNDALKELIKFKSGTRAHSGKPVDSEKAERKGFGADDELDDVKEELFESPEVAIQKNFEVYTRKFLVQQRELAEEVKTVVRHEGDRVIEAITSGPHERILDRDIHKIWKDMRWPGHVKARHFVLALRDYYRQQIEESKRLSHERREGQTTRLGVEDEWAIDYIDISSIQGIAEAFDDDASGFITIAEVNHFTSSRPQGWSLPRWLAYWAVGWHATALEYKKKILTVCAQMFAIRPDIHPANLEDVKSYLDDIWPDIATLTYSLGSRSQYEGLHEEFRSHVDAEEQRLRQGLEELKYDIDAEDTLRLITGPGRIEKYIFPLIYLLLCRDYEIFCVARNRVLHEDELPDAADSLEHVFDAIQDRHDDLEASFQQQGVNITHLFKSFAGGLFSHWHDPDKFWSLSKLRLLKSVEADSNDFRRDYRGGIDRILNYPTPEQDLYPIQEDRRTEADNRANKATFMILGRWFGLREGARDLWPLDPMFSFCLHASSEGGTYEATDTTADGIDFKALGRYTTTKKGQVEYRLSVVYAKRWGKSYFRGTLDKRGTTLSGVWGYSEDKQPYKFCFKRNQDILAARPPPADFKKDRISALWDYALNYAFHCARRTLRWSRTYLERRQALRREYLSLEHTWDEDEDDECTEEEKGRLRYLHSVLTHDDVRYCHVLRKYRQSYEPIEFDADCDNCSRGIYGARVICMECNGDETLDLCDTPACLGAIVSTRDDITSPHTPSHNLVKVRTHCDSFYDVGRILRSADAGLARAKRLLDGVSKSTRSQREEPGGDDDEEGSDSNDDDSSEDDEDDDDDDYDNRRSSYGNDGYGYDDHSYRYNNEGYGDDHNSYGSDDDRYGSDPIRYGHGNVRQGYDSENVDYNRDHDDYGAHSEHSDDDCNCKWCGNDDDWWEKKEDDAPVLICISCSASISTHCSVCWYCIDCPEDANVFICKECDEEKGGIDTGRGTHKATHTLARILSASNSGETDGTSKDLRVTALETEMSGLRGKISELQGEVSGLRGEMSGLITQLDRLLEMSTARRFTEESRGEGSYYHGSNPTYDYGVPSRTAPSSRDMPASEPAAWNTRYNSSPPSSHPHYGHYHSSR